MNMDAEGLTSPAADPCNKVAQLYSGCGRKVVSNSGVVPSERYRKFGLSAYDGPGPSRHMETRRGRPARIVLPIRYPKW